MIASAGKLAHERAPQAESSVYDGTRLLGVIRPQASAFVARLAAGRALGEFVDVRSAMRAICAADRMNRIEAACAWTPQPRASSLPPSARGSSQRPPRALAAAVLLRRWPDRGRSQAAGSARFFSRASLAPRPPNP